MTIKSIAFAYIPIYILIGVGIAGRRMGVAASGRLGEIHSKLPGGTTNSCTKYRSGQRRDESFPEYDYLSGLGLLFAQAQEEAEGVHLLRREWVAGG